MIWHEVDQNSDEWLALRMGKFTASSISDLFMDKKTAGYQKAIIKVAYERVTGESEGWAGNYWTQRGHDREPIARYSFENHTFLELEDAGFYELNEWFGASPDAKIKGANAGVEIKCPSAQVYNEYLDTGKIPKSYYWQIHAQLFCTGWDYIYYFPYSSPNLRQILIKVDRDEEVISAIKEKLITSIEEVQILIKKITL